MATKKREWPKSINRPMRVLAEHAADRLFAARGNHTEIHISRDDLALAMGAVAQAAWIAALSAAERVRTNAEPVKASDDETCALDASEIPADFPVRPLRPDQTAKDRATCSVCGLSWDDGVATGMTPAPSARCPFETFHRE